MTLTTKFGIEPPLGLAGNVRVINALKKVLRRFPGLVERAKNRGAVKVKADIFTPEAAVRDAD